MSVGICVMEVGGGWRERLRAEGRGERGEGRRESGERGCWRGKSSKWRNGREFRCRFLRYLSFSSFINFQVVVGHSIDLVCLLASRPMFADEQTTAGVQLHPVVLS